MDREKKCDSRIWFSIPGSKHVDNRFYKSSSRSFVNVSVTGSRCALSCEHCNRNLLRTMIPAETPERLKQIAELLAGQGGRGMLVSGGADSRGGVPLAMFADAIRHARSLGLVVLAHTGIIEKSTAERLKESGVDQVLMDVIGHRRTIRDVYHLNRAPDDYLDAMRICREAGLDVVPHVVVGLHFGQVLGEYNALKMIREAGVQSLVLVVLNPMPGTGMASEALPPFSDVERVFSCARMWNPEVFLSLGCARPPGPYSRRVETLAVDCGFNGIAFPGEAAIDHAIRQGLDPVFQHGCCSLAGRILL
ncbi:radical SAM family protein [Desulfoluna limicola]|uniref:Radical SAM family protein n=1 Tax=Desulfoluna limicola TaxID=2810562 RepID=A0ABM7PDQ6_9BACT|nr:radical SAM family protein [Desulfoluna limicola]